MSKHLSPDIRVPIEMDNPAIIRNEDLCIKCGKCRDVCRDQISVLTYYDLAKTGDVPICVNCGQCANVCPAGAITAKSEVDAVKAAIADPSKIVIVSTSPSVRVSIGEGFGKAPGTFSEGKMVALLRALGVDIVLDTNFAADMTIVEEASELIARITKKSSAPLPQFTSCCPAWVKFVETYYPELMPNISSAKSPIGMQGPTIKTWFAKKRKINPRQIVNVCLTPCTAKKFEIRRDEMNDSAWYWQDPAMRDMDQCITTREVIAWAKEAGIDYDSLPESSFDSLMSEKSGGAVLFGATGGVMEAAVRAAYEYLNGEPAPAELMQLEAVRGYDGVRAAKVPVTKDLTLRLAVIFGTANVRRFLEDNKLSDYDFIEVMTCPGGCIGGGGQPKYEEGADEARQARIKGLYSKDSIMNERVSTENKELEELYRSFYGKPLSSLAEQMLHTNYYSRENDLGESAANYKVLHETDSYEEVTEPGSDTRKWKCRVCGYVYEGDKPPKECPVCHKGSDAFDLVKKWKCKVCGYVCEDVEPPKECPTCHKGADAFGEIKKWKCKVCGYICEDVEPPKECPTCHKGADAFGEVKVWKCKVCGYVCEDVEPPKECPICHKGADAFEEVDGGSVPQTSGEYEEITPFGARVRKWKCRTCGFVYEGATPPEECPECHQDVHAFDQIRKWKCKICGYVCEGVTPPAECPTCHKGSDAFEEVKTWKCMVCGCVCEGVTPPAECPICHKGAEAFAEEKVWKCKVCGYVCEGVAQPAECPSCPQGMDAFQEL